MLGLSENCLGDDNVIPTVKFACCVLRTARKDIYNTVPEYYTCTPSCISVQSSFTLHLTATRSTTSTSLDVLYQTLGVCSTPGSEFATTKT
jgi:hypothetical protein